MSKTRERFREVLSRPFCTVAANIFDPLSARIAHMLDYEVCTGALQPHMLVVRGAE